MIPQKNATVDLHSHVLPGVDDGSRDTEESLELLLMEYDQGIRHIIFTPHYRRTGDNLMVRAAYEQFLCQVREKAPELFQNVEFGLGHELVWHENLIERLREGQAFTLCETGHVLIEFQPDVYYERMVQQLRELLNAGFVPVIAHMERYQALYEDEHIADLKRMGCLMQLNYQSLTGDGMTGQDAPFGGVFSKEVKRARRLVREGMIDFYGTDAHRRDYRPPNIKKALEWLKKNG